MIQRLWFAFAKQELQARASGVILSMRQASQINLYFEQTNLVGLLVFISCAKLSNDSPPHMNYSVCLHYFLEIFNLPDKRQYHQSPNIFELYLFHGVLRFLFYKALQLLR